MTEKTSLMDFISKAHPEPEEISTDETSTDEETTVTETEADSVLEDPDASEGDDNTGDESTDGSDQLFEVKGAKVPLKDLLNAFETREEISRRFSELDREKKKVQSDKERAKKEREELDFINEKFEEMHELVLSGNPIAALHIALSMNPKESSQPAAMKELIEQAVAIAENFQAMDEDEQKVFLDKEELSVKERNLARKEKRIKEKEDSESLSSYYDKVLTDYKITDPEIEKAVEDINKLPNLREVFAAKTDAKERINYCTSWVLGQRLNNTILDGIKSVNPKLATDEFRVALLDLVDPSCTIEDVAATVREYLKITSKDSALESAAPKQDATKKVVTPNRTPTDKKAENSKPILSWDDIIAKYNG